MVTARPINVERALVDPRGMFKEPIKVLACADLDAAHKRQILECWRQGAPELQTDDDESMSGGEEPMLKRVLDASRTLERQTGAQPLARLSRCRDGEEIGCYRLLMASPVQPASPFTCLRTAREMRGKGIRTARARPPLGHSPGMGV